MTRREWYERVNAAWPTKVPPLTADEAERALRRLYRYCYSHAMRDKVIITSGNRHTRRRWSPLGTRVWYVNPERGWQDLVHVLSHYAERSGHNRKHARMELRMIKEVIKRGWLDGKLRPEPWPEPVRDPRAERRARAKAGLERWQRKLKYAQHKVAHYVRSVRRYEMLDRKVIVPTFEQQQGGNRMIAAMLTVDNQKDMTVRVFDGAMYLGSYPGGTVKTVALQARGPRVLTVRWFGGDAHTAERDFAENRAWRLTVSINGRLDLDLEPK